MGLDFRCVTSSSYIYDIHRSLSVVLPKYILVRFLVTWEAVEHEGPYVVSSSLHRYFPIRSLPFITTQRNLRHFLSIVPPLYSLPPARLWHNGLYINASRRLVPLFWRLRRSCMDT